MKQYVIIGNGVAGAEAALELRRRLSPEEGRILLISDESPYFFSRTALMYAFMDRLDRRDLEPYERKVWDIQKIERVQARVVDLDASRRCITLESGEELSFDRCLVATGASPRMVPFEGLDAVEDGLVHFVSLDDLDACERLARTSDRAVVVGGGLIGVELVECFLHHGLEVTFLVREPYFWPAALAAEEGEMISEHIGDHGVELIHGEELHRIDVDEAGKIVAIQTTGERTLPTDILGICIGVVPTVDWLRDVTTPPTLKGGLLVDRSFATSLDGVYGAGDCVVVDLGVDGPPKHEPIWYTARDHGRLAARSILGDDVRYEPPVFYNSSKFFDVEYTTVGAVQDLPPGTGALFRSHPDKLITQRILHATDGERRVLGFNMLGSRWDHRLLQRWIEERRGLNFVRRHLHEAQFDVEFGRANLEKMNEKEILL